MGETSEMLGKWDWRYAGATQPLSYGEDTTYRLGAEYLSDCSLIEDWGCGFGYFASISKNKVVGLDGSATAAANFIKTDLAKYRSSVPGIFMRHVLEHNRNWKDILCNSVASFTNKMVLIMFTPFVERTYDMDQHADIPVIAFCKDDLVCYFANYLDKIDTLKTNTQFGVEHIFYLRK